MKSLKGHGILSVDAQGFLRYVDGEKVYPCAWENKLEAFKYIDILKVNEHEIESLTGYTDLKMAAKQFDAWGVKEVLMTLGSYGSVIFVEGKFYEIPAFKPRKVKGAGYVEAGKYAAAMCTLKIEHTGPFDRSEDEVFKVMGTR